jgi:hypothetical protein
MKMEHSRLAETRTEEDYEDYFSHNRTIVGVLSLFCGFLFTSITILLNALVNPSEILAQTTILFLTIIFYLSLYTLIDNLEMGFHYIKKIPILTGRVAPFFRLLVIFYLFGAATVMLFLLFGLFYLSLVCGMLWIIIVAISFRSIVKPFFGLSRKMGWRKKK